MTFKRYEIKYLISLEQERALRALSSYRVHEDEFGKSTIYSLYYDTQDFALIRRSLEKPAYKEKFRIRSYGPATPESTVFLELKKKFQQVVYKRREQAAYSDAVNYLGHGVPLSGNEQILSEIDYFISIYPGLAPKVLMTYEREAFYSDDQPNIRITFDRNILWRDRDLTLSCRPYGEQLLDENTVLVEVKTIGSVPLWLSGFLSCEGIFPTSFSKYGSVYKNNLLGKGAINYA